jgi:methionine synthase I (cobalamin-dependent)
LVFVLAVIFLNRIITREKQKEYNFKIFGGCCGTNDAFMISLAEKITSVA